jgi:hypothetical protein
MSSDKIEHEDCAPAEIEKKAPFTTLLCQLSASTVFSGLPDALVAFGVSRLPRRATAEHSSTWPRPGDRYTESIAGGACLPPLQGLEK